MSCASLMMQGTTSDAGKSSLVALLDVEVDFVARREADLNRLADAVEQSLNWQTMTEILQESHHA